MRIDTATGLYYDNARWYDSVNSVFISQDPLGFAAGQTNLEEYVGNRPANYFDPSGMEGLLMPWDPGASWNPATTAGLWGRAGIGGLWNGVWTTETDSNTNVSQNAYEAAGQSYAQNSPAAHQALQFVSQVPAAGKVAKWTDKALTALEGGEVNPPPPSPNGSNNGNNVGGPTPDGGQPDGSGPGAAGPVGVCDGGFGSGGGTGQPVDKSLANLITNLPGPIDINVLNGVAGPDPTPLPNTPVNPPPPCDTIWVCFVAGTPIVVPDDYNDAPTSDPQIGEQQLQGGDLLVAAAALVAGTAGVQKDKRHKKNQDEEDEVLRQLFGGDSDDDLDRNNTPARRTGQMLTEIAMPAKDRVCFGHVAPEGMSSHPSMDCRITACTAATTVLEEKTSNERARVGRFTALESRRTDRLDHQSQSASPQSNASK